MCWTNSCCFSFQHSLFSIMQGSAYSESSTCIFFFWSLFALGMTVRDILIVRLLDTVTTEYNRPMSFHFAFLVWILVTVCKRCIYTMPCTLVTLDFQRARAYHCGLCKVYCTVLVFNCVEPWLLSVCTEMHFNPSIKRQDI